MVETEVLTTTDFPSIIHQNEISDELVKWGNENNYPIKKAKLVNKLNGYVGFSEGFFIAARQKPPVPGGWTVTVEKFQPETRIIPLNVNKQGEINRFVKKMIEQYALDGLAMKLSDKIYDSYGTRLQDLTVTGHPFLISQFEDFIENMR